MNLIFGRLRAHLLTGRTIVLIFVTGYLYAVKEGNVKVIA